MTKIKLAIVDNNSEFRKSIIRTINLEKDLKVMIEAEEDSDLFRQLKSKNPDIILMNIPIKVGVEAIDKIKSNHPNIKIITYSQYFKINNIIEMYIHGINGFSYIEDGSKEVIKAIRIVSVGGIFITEKASEFFWEYLAHGLDKMNQKEFTSIQLKDYKLLKMIIEGFTSKEIGQKLCKSHRTIEDMRNKLYKKYNVANKQQLVLLINKLLK